MAGWADLYNPPSGVPLGFTLGDIATKRARAQQDFGQQKFDQGQAYSRAVTDTVGSFAARGAGRSGAKNQATNRIFEDYTRDQGKGQLDLNRALEDLDRQRRLATMGVIY